MQKTKKFPTSLSIVAIVILFPLFLFFVGLIPVSFFFVFSHAELPDIDGAKTRSIAEIKQFTEEECGLDVNVRIIDVEIVNWDRDRKKSQFYRVSQKVEYKNTQYEVRTLVYSDLKLWHFNTPNVERLSGSLKFREIL